MNISAYVEFVEADRSGRKGAAATAIQAFIGSFESIDEKRAWVVEFSKTFYPGKKIRHELYAEVVFPVLLRSYRNSEIWGIEWLAATSQNLYRAKNLWAQLEFITEYGLLKQWRTLAPESGPARDALLKKMIEGFEYSEHEWPAKTKVNSSGERVPGRLFLSGPFSVWYLDYLLSRERRQFGYLAPENPPVGRYRNPETRVH